MKGAFFTSLRLKEKGVPCGIKLLAKVKVAVKRPDWIFAAFGSVKSVRQILSAAHVTPVNTLPSPTQVTEVDAVPSPYHMSLVKSMSTLCPVINS